VGGHREFVHHGMPGNAGKGEPGEPNRPDGVHGNHGDKGKPTTGNGNGNGNDGVSQGNVPRTGGNNQASPAGTQGNHGNHGNQGSHGNYGNYGGSQGPGMSTGGPLPGLLDVAPDIARQLGNSLLSLASGAQSVLRDGGARPEPRHVPGPPAHANANANASAHPGAAAGAPHSSASGQAQAHAGAFASARADGVPLPSAMNAPFATGRAQGAFAAQGSAAPAGATLPNAAAPTAASAASSAATMAQSAALTPQQRADAMLAAPNRPADAALAAGRTAANTPATAPPPTNAVPPTLPNAPAPPPGTTAALTAAGLTMATAVNQPADARGVILPANDAVAALRGENVLNNPAGHTLDGAQRRSLRSRLGSMPQGGLARLLWAMGAAGHTNTGEAGAEREFARAMQWLFWMLALIAYGCVAAAIVIFVGSDGRLMDSVADRNSTAWLAMCGLATGVFAWAVARRISRRR
jgi:hypothetical protein